MIFDLLRDTPPRDCRADVCLVGAGAAGIVLALELRRQGKTVLLLEGGGEDVEEAAQEPYRSEVVGLEHRGIHGGRFRAKGGTTTRWGGQILELDREDFDVREWVDGSGWPFAKTELVPFYERALKLEGLDGVERSDAAVWKRLGLPMTAFGELEPYFSRWCPDPVFARLHADALEKDEGLSLWLHANCVTLLREQETVRGVRCRTQSGIEAVFTADEFVFCMGTIECCRFFLQPHEGGLPWNRSGLLGKHFQDHLDSNAAEVRPRDRKAFGALFDNVFLGGYKYHPKLRLGAEEQRRARVLNAGATMYFLSDVDEVLGELKGTAKNLLRGRLGEIKAKDVAGLVRNAPLLAAQTLRYGLEHRAFNPASAVVKLRVHCEQEPLSASSISLAEERDSLGMLRTRLDWRISEFEMETIRHYAVTAAKSLAGVAEVVVDPMLLDGDGAAYLAAWCDDSNHHMGGMRMAADAAAGVVDPNLRLHGTRNCYVCSGAVFPTSGFSNPTHTLLALAVRLADHLALKTTGGGGGVLYKPVTKSDEAGAIGQGMGESGMRRIEIAGTSRTTTQLGYGCSSLMGGMGRKESLAMLEAAFDAGIRHFDVAPLYGFGAAEDCLGEFLSRHKGDVTVTTKYGIAAPKSSGLMNVARQIARPILKQLPGVKAKLVKAASSVAAPTEKVSFTAEQARLSLERSLAALRVERIDVWLLHEVRADDLADDGLLRFLEDSVTRGVIGSFGVGGERSKLPELLRSRAGYCRVLQYEWSVLDDTIGETAAFRFHYRALTENFRKLHDLLVADSATCRRWSNVVGADLGDRKVLAQMMLKAALEENPESVILVSSKNAAHVQDNVRVAGDAGLVEPARRLHELVQTEGVPGTGVAA